MGKIRLILITVFQRSFKILYKIPFLSNIFHNLTCFLAGLSRLFSGIRPLPPFAKGNILPKKRLILYEYEGCPFCRVVRETLSLLSIDVLIYPCPRETLKRYGHLEHSRFRGEVKRLGNKVMFPYLVDENTGKSMYESKDIMLYLWKHYGGDQKRPFFYRLSQTGFLFVQRYILFYISNKKQQLMRLDLHLIYNGQQKGAQFCQKHLAIQ